jgi:hypothetical protein
MLTKIEKTELTKELVALFNAGEVDKAATLVKERWLIFSHLPSALRDNDDIAYAAVTANMQAWKGLSPRLINDINFFKTTFNKTNTHRIWFEKPRDMLFITAYANKNRIYAYLIPY